MTTESFGGAQGTTPSNKVAVHPVAALPVDGTDSSSVVTGQTQAGPELGSSPYATGGGGVSLAHRIAAVYLASILTGERRTEASELPIRQVSFQTGPAHPVDDLLLVCSDGTTEITMAVACRATPNFVQSDEQTVKLVGSLLDEVTKFDTPTHQVAVAVAGWSNQGRHLATVCDIARGNATAATFKASLDVDKRWSKQIRDRLDQFLLMVNLATNQTKTEAEVLQLAFTLLSRLHILGFAVQSPDESDRTAVASSLDSVAADTANGVNLRDRLEVEATRYDRVGAVVDLNLLRRDLYTLLKTSLSRNNQAWKALAEHRRVAAASVRHVIGGDSTLQLEISFADRRDQLTAAIREVGTETAALVVSGESGTGKSALTLSAIAQLEAEDPTGFEALVVNLRALPQTGMEIGAAIGASMADVLSELSAPTRVLVIDAADASLERSASVLSDLVLAAAQAGVGVIAVASDTAREFVYEQMTLGFDNAIASFTTQPLGDTEIKAVAEHFPLLRPVLRNLPATSLLRRLIVLDLLARTGTELNVSMNEWDCLDLVWRRIVRGEGNPAAGSAQARDQTMLAVAAATLNLPSDRHPIAVIDPAAVDSLRRDHLFAPASPYLSIPEFAHDEVRRYATAILLVRAPNLTDTLLAAGGLRWALSSATLACKGQLRALGIAAPLVFARMVREFDTFAIQHGPRWADLPVEALLDTPDSYECLKAELADQTSPLRLGDVLRIVGQRHRIDGLPDPIVARPVVRILLDRPEPWQVSEPAFELLADWLQALVRINVAAGDPLRIRLRDHLINYWNSFPPPEPAENDSEDYCCAEMSFSSKRRRQLPYEVTDERFVECLALLGPDIDGRVEQCLLAVANDAPALLAPAADSPMSARAVALHDTELLAKLIEAYYIDAEESDWNFEEGVRSHQGRWLIPPPPLSEYYFGGFWVLFNNGSRKTSVRVLNKILNHGARNRVRTIADLHIDPFEVALNHQSGGERETGAELNLDGTTRLYVGDTHVWSWYRGTSVGPYSGMSALLAMERVAEGWLDAGATPAQVVKHLLEGCENLAVPGMLFGLLTRHIDKVTDELNPFLSEPVVWQLEFARVTWEYSGLRFHTEGLKEQQRRNWSPQEVSFALMVSGDKQRTQDLKAVGDLLIANGDRIGFSQDRTKDWAASLDAVQYEVTQRGDQLYLQVNPPANLRVAQAQHALYQEQINTRMRLENRYWGSAKHQRDYVAPTSVEIAQDLAEGRQLLDAQNEIMLVRPLNAVAQVARVAVHRAATGDLEALGTETEFVAKLVLEVALAFKTSDDQRDEDQYFDLGADRAVASSVPAFLTPVLADLLPRIGATTVDVQDAGMAIAGKAPLETRLFLARGCDILWAAPCHGSPCMHETAVHWLLETARGAEMGPWDVPTQRHAYVYIDGDIPARLQELDSTAIDLSMLDAPIRGLGAAAATSHCQAKEATRLLDQFLDVQRRIMVAYMDNGRSTGHGGTHTRVAARALLDSYAVDHDPLPIFNHLDVLSADASLLSGFLNSLAAVGAENDERAQAARDFWPAVLKHALGYATLDPNPFRDNRWGKWAASALLPAPLSWTQGPYTEFTGPAIDWVKVEDLVEFIAQWVLLGCGETMCVDALIGVLRKLPLTKQATLGLDWITELCTRRGQIVVKQSWHSNDWLSEVHSTAEDIGLLDKWQKLVDAMVVAGNEGLAPYSR